MKNSLDKRILDTFFINSIVFDDNPIKVIKQNLNQGNTNNSNIIFDRILYLLDAFVNEYNDMQFLDDYMVQNIYNIVDYIRDNYVYIGGSKQKIYEFRNKILSGINNYFGANDNSFYLDQFNKRGVFLDCSNNVDEFNIPDTIKKDIQVSLSFDNFFYDILIKDRKNIPDKTIDILVMNTMFVYSVNFFRFECPSLLEQNIVLKEVLIANKKIINSLNFKLGINKECDKTKCLIKSTKQLLNAIRWS